MSRFVKKYLDDLLIIAGSATVIAGISLWNYVIAIISAGLAMIIFGVLVGIGKAKNDHQ